MADQEKIPVHVSVIMDGNGRWAKMRGEERIFGHKAGADSVRACVEYAIEKGIKYLSLFAFSEENWGRPVAEVEGLMKMMLKAILDETPSFMKNGIRFKAIGNLSRLSEGLRNQIDECMAVTAGNTNLTLIIFLSYSGKWDILQAVNRFMQDNEGKEGMLLDADLLSRYLSTRDIPDPDLLIRTSGEQRISNYMLWQTAYTEYYFTDVLWPDFRKTQFQEALDAFAMRDRRYGKVK